MLEGVCISVAAGSGRWPGDVGVVSASFWNAGQIIRDGVGSRTIANKDVLNSCEPTGLAGDMSGYRAGLSVGTDGLAGRFLRGCLGGGCFTCVVL